MSEYSVTHILGEPIICETCHEKVRQVAAFEPHYICVDCAFDALAAENARLRKEASQLYAALKLYRPGIWDTVDAMTREKMVDAALAVHDARIREAIDNAA